MNVLKILPILALILISLNCALSSQAVAQKGLAAPELKPRPVVEEPAADPTPDTTPLPASPNPAPVVNDEEAAQRAAENFEKIKNKQAAENRPADQQLAGDASQPSQPIGISFSNPVAAKWKVGARIIGGAGPAKNMLLTIPIPNEWPEQRVTIAGETIPHTIGDVDYRDLDSGVRQLVVKIPFIGAREDITVTMTFLISTSQIEAPANPSVFLRPSSRNKTAKSYLGTSPQINFRDAKIRKQVKTLVEDKPHVWAEVESIFDWVRENIEQRESNASDAAGVLRNQSGNAEGKVGLFVAMCRANKIPARMVWVEGTQYGEFMLVDENDNAHWFPCQLAGIREFGSISDPRIILQKGDNIRVPEKEARQKFVAEFATCKGNSKPKVGFVRLLLPVEE